jgi:hypothetical protein
MGGMTDIDFDAIKALVANRRRFGGDPYLCDAVDDLLDEVERLQRAIANHSCSPRDALDMD